MKTIPDEAIDAFEDDELVIGGSCKLVLPSGTYRFASGYGTLQIDGEDYLGIGARALVTDIHQDKGGGADGIEITLSGLDHNVAQSIEAEDYAQKPMTIRRLVFDKKGQTLLAAPVFMRGRLNVVTANYIIGGKAALVFKIEGPRLDMSRKGARIRSDSDQRVLGGSIDGAMRHISVAGRKILTWGQTGSKAQNTMVDHGVSLPGPGKVLIFGVWV